MPGLGASGSFWLDGAVTKHCARIKKRIGPNFGLQCGLVGVAGASVARAPGCPEPAVVCLDHRFVGAVAAPVSRQRNHAVISKEQMAALSEGCPSLYVSIQSILNKSINLRSRVKTPLLLLPLLLIETLPLKLSLANTYLLLLPPPRSVIL